MQRDTSQTLKQSSHRLFRKLKTVPRKVVCLIGVFVCLLTYSIYRSEYVLSTWFVPVERLYQCTTETCLDCWLAVRGYLADRRVLAENNAHLTSALLEYEKQFFDYEQIKSENAYLREILPVIKEQNLDTLTVIHHLKTPFITLVYTSPNVSNRIKIGHIVISPQGMVGYITSKRQKQGYCEVLVLLPTHIQSRIPVIGERNQSTAILCGQNSSIMSIQYPLGDQKSAEDSFVECPAKKFDDGELLFLLGTKIPVAKVAPQRDKAIWVVKPTGRVTIVISENMLGDVSDSDLASDLTNK